MTLLPFALGFAACAVVVWLWHWRNERNERKAAAQAKLASIEKRIDWVHDEDSKRYWEHEYKIAGIFDRLTALEKRKRK